MRNESKVTAAVALVLGIADLALLIYIRSEMVASVGWAQLLGAISMQVALIAGLRTWLGLRGRLQRQPLQQGDSEISYRGQIPVTAVGIVLLVTGFSLCLLYLGFVCPAQGMPMMRGRPICG